MRILCAVGLFFSFHSLSIAQNPLFEQSSTKQMLEWRADLPTLTNDTLRMAIARDLAFYYMEVNRDSTTYFAGQQLVIAKKLKQALWEADGYEQLGYVHFSLGNYTKSLQALLAGRKIAENEDSENNIWRLSRFSTSGNARHGRLNVLANLYNDLAELYGATQNHEKRLSYYKACEKLGRILNDATLLSLVSSNLGTFYYEQNKLDSALIFHRRALTYSNQAKFEKYKGYTMLGIGLIHSKKETWDSARYFFVQSIQISLAQNNQYDVGQAYIALSVLLRKTAQYNSSLLYAKRALSNYLKIGSPLGALNAYGSLAATFESKKRNRQRIVLSEACNSSQRQLDQRRKDSSVSEHGV